MTSAYASTTGSKHRDDRDFSCQWQWHDGLLSGERLGSDLVLQALDEPVAIDRTAHARPRRSLPYGRDPRHYSANMRIASAELTDIQSIDDREQFAWPAYVANLRARLKCPLCLLVVADDETVPLGSESGEDRRR